MQVRDSIIAHVYIEMKHTRKPVLLFFFSPRQSAANCHSSVQQRRLTAMVATDKTVCVTLKRFIMLSGGLNTN